MSSVQSIKDTQGKSFLNKNSNTCDKHEYQNFRSLCIKARIPWRCQLSYSKKTVVRDV